MIPEAFMRLLEKYEAGELSETEMVRFKKLMKNREVKAFMNEREQLEQQLNQLAHTKLNESLVDSLIPQITNEMESHFLINGFKMEEDTPIKSRRRWFGYVSAGVVAAACIGFALLLFPQIQSQIERPTKDDLYSDVVAGKHHHDSEQTESAQSEENVIADNLTTLKTEEMAPAIAETPASSAGSEQDSQEERSVATAVAAPDKADSGEGSERSVTEAIEAAQSKVSSGTGSSAKEVKPVEPVKPVKPVEPVQTANNLPKPEPKSPAKTEQPTVKQPLKTSDDGQNTSNSVVVPPLFSSQQNGGSEDAASSMGMKSTLVTGIYQIRVEGEKLVIRDGSQNVIIKSAYAVKSDAEQVFPVGWQTYGESYRYKVVGPTGTQLFDIKLDTGTETKVRE
jgi:outer membrane biosynthesis protein TonB